VPELQRREGPKGKKNTKKKLQVCPIKPEKTKGFQRQVVRVQRITGLQQSNFRRGGSEKRRRRKRITLAQLKSDTGVRIEKKKGGPRETKGRRIVKGWGKLTEGLIHEERST